MTRVRLRPLFAIVAIVAVALNLRPALAAIGPLLDMIQAATGATNTQASLLTTLPVFVMGICALAGGRLNKYLNERTGIALGVALVALACAARYVGTQTYGLLLTAVL